MVKNHKIKLNFILSLVILVFSFLAVTARTEAATISVSAGVDAKVADAVCRLSEAIENINNQAQTNADCAAGTGNDVINLPTGTITLTADLPVLTRSVTIQGQGTNRSVIDGAGRYRVFRTNTANGEMTFRDFKTKSFKGIGILGEDAKSIEINNIEVDGTGAISDADGGMPILGGFVLFSSGSASPVIVVDGLYVHDLTSADAFFLLGMGVRGSANKVQNVTAKNITIANLTGSNPNGQVVGVLNSVSIGDGISSPLQGVYENITIENVTSLNAQSVVGFDLSGSVAGGGSVVGDVTLRNATVRNITHGTQSFLNASSAIGLVGAGEGISDHFDGRLKLQNVVIVNASENSVPRSCKKGDISGILDGWQGSAVLSLESIGGNISDDESCNDFFKHATDQKNKTKLKDTLGALSDNGGSIPTIPLKAGSPAIDTGVCKDAPTKDARGVSRPQGSACDAGAFEVRQAAMSSPQGSPNTATNKKIFIDAPVPGAVVRSASIIPSSEANSDSSHDYPLGLVGFTIEGVPSGSKQTMNLYFETDTKAEEFVARKYNQHTREYRDIPGAVLSNETRNGEPVIKLSYQVTDGGELDLDGVANGSILDPVGLAKQKSLLASTGTTTMLTSLVAAVLIAAVALVGVDYRRHKAPLIELDKQTHQNLAASYTFWHHIKVVTIPTMRYRFTIILDKKTTV